MEHLRPFLVAQRILVCAGYGRLVRTAVNRGRRDLRTKVIWSQSATGHQDEQRSRAGQCDWWCSFQRGGVHARPPCTSGVTLGSPRGACVESIVRFFPPPVNRWERYSTTENVTGTMRIPMTDASDIPPITTVPRMRRETAPEPLAVHNGKQPNMKARAVMIIGLNRRRAACTADSAMLSPFS